MFALHAKREQRSGELSVFDPCRAETDSGIGHDHVVLHAGFICDLNAFSKLSYTASADGLERREIVASCPSVEHEDGARAAVCNYLCHVGIYKETVNVIDDVGTCGNCLRGSL